MLTGPTLISEPSVAILCTVASSEPLSLQQSIIRTEPHCRLSFDCSPNAGVCKQNSLLGCGIHHVAYQKSIMHKNVVTKSL